MRKITYAITMAAAALFVSCENTMDFKLEGAEERLVMNAQMYTADTVHYVMLCVSGNDRVRRIRDGVVTCFVNGEKVATATEPVEINGFEDRNVHYYYLEGKTPGETRQTCYAIKARFSPGDKVRLEVSVDGGEFSASSEVTVPEPPVFRIADTTLTDGYSTGTVGIENLLKVRIKGQDKKGEKTYYRLGEVSDYREDHYYYGWGDNTQIQRATNTLKPDPLDDHILLDGSQNSDFPIGGGSEGNDFLVFSDNFFADGEYDFTFSVPGRDFHPYYGSSAKQYFMSCDLSVRMYVIPEIEYRYLKAACSVLYNDGDFTISEPVSLPSNVEGGLGIVSVSSEANDTIRFTYGTEFEIKEED